MKGLDQKVVLITGGATGIGLATGKRLLEQGARVLLTGHREDQLCKARADLAEFGERLSVLVADVRDSAALGIAAKTAGMIYGKLDGMVSAAGIQIAGSASVASEEEWNSVLDVNLSGAFRTCKAVLPSMMAGGGGSIVLVSSVQALRGKRNGVAYVASKGGINAMMRALAMDHASENIRVNAVCPGVVDTPLLREAVVRASPDHDIEDVVRHWSDSQPLSAGIKRVCTADDVANLIAFLISDEAAYITGGEYSIDGGLAAKLAM